MTPPGPQPLWTASDLAARWRCSEAKVMRVVRERGVPYVPFGRGECRLGRRGPASLRFRPAAIEAWEAEQEGRWEPDTGGEASAPGQVLTKRLARGRKAWVPE